MSDDMFSGGYYFKKLQKPFKILISIQTGSYFIPSNTYGA